MIPIQKTVGNMARRTAEQAVRQAKAQGIEHVSNERGATIAIRHSVIETEMTSVVTGKGSGIMRDENFYTLSFNDKRPDEQVTFYPAARIIMDYFSDDSMPYYANDSITEFVNQGERDGWVLAVIGNEMLIEYEMPAGSTAMVYYLIKNGEHTNRRTISYATCPKRWIAAMREAKMTWVGMGQRACRAYPFPEEEKAEMFLELSEAETLKFRQWADENFAPGDEINSTWHPVVQARCAEIIEEEAQLDADIAMSHLKEQQAGA